MWHDFGGLALASIKGYASARGVTFVTEVTNGEPAYECDDGIRVSAWISGLPPEPLPQSCVFTPRVSWTFRIHHCVDVNAPSVNALSWHRALEVLWCGLTDFLVSYCQNCPITYDNGTVFTPSGNQIVADLSVTLEEGCSPPPS